MLDGILSLISNTNIDKLIIFMVAMMIMLALIVGATCTFITFFPDVLESEYEGNHVKEKP